MLQWRRAGYDISDRPDILFTLFNVGFSQSVPKPNPVAGASNLKAGARASTFGAIGFDFYYRGDLADAFPFQRQRFKQAERALTPEDVARIQQNMSDCARPERGLEYRRDSTAQPSDNDQPDPFGIDHSKVVPMEHTAQ